MKLTTRDIFISNWIWSKETLTSLTVRTALWGRRQEAPHSSRRTLSSTSGKNSNRRSEKYFSRKAQLKLGTSILNRIIQEIIITGDKETAKSSSSSTCNIFWERSLSSDGIIPCHKIMISTSFKCRKSPRESKRDRNSPKSKKEGPAQEDAACLRMCRSLLGTTIKRTWSIR